MLILRVWCLAGLLCAKVETVIRKLVHGDPKYRIPDMDPMKITELVVNQGDQQIGLNLTIKDFGIYGLKEAKFTGSRMDLKKKHVEWDFLIPKLMILGDYIASGKVLVLPISGNGKGNITLLNVNATYKFDYKLEKVKGEDYLKITTKKLVFDTSRLYVRMENLFNGEKVLGDAMHQFMDENWRDVVKELGPAIADAIGSIFTLILTNIASVVPFKDMVTN
ncbi:protein takeout-like isoform X2 [Homalodisca vitripennis]|uniref:protein takeout-like isoform X2 n=1 Tax=Homalodisca vitripennis TaxID=197043 RepID=UPI001EEBB8C6|nr:protein takeout-like isoform X2 [Homalodisca vitripennis]